MSNAFLQNLECAICLDVFEEPRILTNCGHTLCHQCIVSMLKRNKNDNTLSIICPTCFKETKLVNNDIKCLKINFQLLTVLDTVNKKKIIILNILGEMLKLVDHYQIFIKLIIKIYIL